jgi:hypothetical protein
MQTSTVFPQAAPSPWGMQYGNFPKPPVDYMGYHTWNLPSLASGQATALQPQDQDAFFEPATGHTNTLVHTTPIATPAMRITMPSDNKMLPAASNGADAEDNASTDEHTAAALTESSAPKHTKSRTAIINTFVPNESRQYSMDEDHLTPSATVDRLNHETIMHLQIFNITLAATLQHTLKDAKAAFEAQESAHMKKRAVLLSLLQATRGSELAHEVNVRHHYDQFHYHMTEACAKQGDAKSAAQTEATSQLKSATNSSKLALEDRSRIEQYRNNLLDIDNARAISRNAYSDTVHNVLIRALGGEAVESGAAMNVRGFATQSGMANASTPSRESGTPASNDGSKSGKAYVGTPDAQQATRQGVFETHPRAENQSISEVLGAMDITGERAKEIEASTQQQQQDDDANLSTQEHSKKQEAKAKTAKEKAPGYKAKNKTSATTAAPMAQSVEEPKNSSMLDANAPQFVPQPSPRKKHKKHKKNKQKNGDGDKSNDGGKGNGGTASKAKTGAEVQKGG